MIAITFLPLQPSSSGHVPTYFHYNPFILQFTSFITPEKKVGGEKKTMQIWNGTTIFGDGPRVVRISVLFVGLELDRGELEFNHADILTDFQLPLLLLLLILVLCSLF